MGGDVTLFTKEELVERLQIEKATLEAWEAVGLLKPAGNLDDGAPYYDLAHTEEGAKLKALMAMGYDLTEIGKIVSKVGLPSSEDKERRAKERLISIGELADKSDVSQRTLKYWEEKGLMEPDARSKGGYRLYGESFVEICQRIRELQLFGYTIEELRGMRLLFLPSARLRDELEVTNGDERAAALETFAEQQQALAARVAELKKALKRWETITKQQGKLAQELRPKRRG